MTDDLLNALADVLDGIAKVRAVAIFANEDEAEHSLLRLGDAGDAVSIALGLLPEATWQDTATALRAHAATIAPGLPEGWSVADSSIRYSDYTRHEANGPRLSSVLLYRYNDGRLSVSGDIAPPAVYAYLLARAGVGS
jgi:hypothetical protein